MRAPVPVMTPQFCSPFDRALAEQGPPAVFLVDREGLLRFDSEWTRDAWGRIDPDESVPVEALWCLARDRASGFVLMVYVTSARLLRDHPRLDVRAFEDGMAASAELKRFGSPAVAPEPW